MKKVYAYLNGGIGNQMFQYATARAVAYNNQAELIIDNWSGFIRDFEYKRKYELNKLPINARVTSAFERIPIWLYRFENRINGINKNFYQKKLYGEFLVENEMRFLKEIFKFEDVKNIWLCGYWQSPKYFEKYKNNLYQELMPSDPVGNKFLELGAIMHQTESVALGIRLYEESNNPNSHLKNAMFKTISEINIAIHKLILLHPKAKFYVFCTHHSLILNELNLPDNTLFLTHDDGYEGTVERLWLLTQCKHHIFTASSFYWWGAWLSQTKNSVKSIPQFISCADNFINEDSHYFCWDKF